MARGQQKLQSQAKAADKAAKAKKQQGHSANDQKKAAQKALVHVCAVCKVRGNLWPREFRLAVSRTESANELRSSVFTVLQFYVNFSLLLMPFYLFVCLFVFFFS